MAALTQASAFAQRQPRASTCPCQAALGVPTPQAAAQPQEEPQPHAPSRAAAGRVYRPAAARAKAGSTGCSGTVSGCLPVCCCLCAVCPQRCLCVCRFKAIGRTQQQPNGAEGPHRLQRTTSKQQGGAIDLCDSSDTELPADRPRKARKKHLSATAGAASESEQDLQLLQPQVLPASATEPSMQLPEGLHTSDLVSCVL